MAKKTSEGTNINVPKNKSEWIELFSMAGIHVEDESTLNEILKFGANKLKIKKVSDYAISDLKKEIVNHFNNNFRLEKVSYSNTDEKEQTDTKETETEISQESDLESLRKECESIGLAWGSKHTASDLKQLLAAIKGAPRPTTTQETASKQQPVHHSQSKQGQPTQEKQIAKTSIDQYGQLFIDVIKRYFRKMTKQQILGLYAKGSYPFGYDIVINPANSYQVKINLISEGQDNLYPKDHWIDTAN